MAVSVVKSNIMNLTRSLEKILEESTLSGELKLNNRSIKEFPKNIAKYNLNDLVYADLSRNRFCELPEDVTSFAFLERLLLYHNAIRSIPETVRGLHSLTYLDLRNNQLTVLPREVCLLPLQIFLVSNNRLTQLPDELGRMNELTELDAACNQLTHLPARLSDLTNLRALSVRSNQLVYLPRELTSLQLVTLDLSCNRIAQLPVELRLMTSLVDLELSDNPLTSPPAQLCVRGIVHVFKYLETVAAKDGKIDGNTTLRRPLNKQQSNPGTLMENHRVNRQNVDSGYSTSDGGIDNSRWCHETLPKWHAPTTPLHIRADINLNKSESSITSNGTGSFDMQSSLEDDVKKQKSHSEENLEKKNNNILSYSSNDISPEDTTPDSQKSDDKNKFGGNIQTYREYKEQLRQQRSQDVYRTKDQVSTPDGSTESPVSSFKSSPSPSIYSNQNSPMSPYQTNTKFSGSLNGNTSPEEQKGRPVQKVTPSRIVTSTYQSPSNGNHTTDYAYVKPNSPIKGTGILQHNSLPNPNINGKGALANGHKPLTATVGYVNNTKTGQKPNKTVSWNRDVPAEKLSFTMRREFDKHKEEVELIKQLRIILDSKLKMTLPEDIAPSLTDGVVLCHLANHIRARSVGSIHVPSPAVPKLTMARCRRNVDNFLEACRKIGVDENLMCCAADVLEGRGLVQVAITVSELVKFQQSTPPNTIKSPTRYQNHNASNLNKNNNNSNSTESFNSKSSTSSSPISSVSSPSSPIV
ncbi:unnamed protein product [Diamesa hyperborea]